MVTKKIMKRIVGLVIGSLFAFNSMFSGVMQVSAEGELNSTDNVSVSSDNSGQESETQDNSKAETVNNANEGSCVTAESSVLKSSDSSNLSGTAESSDAASSSSESSSASSSASTSSDAASSSSSAVMAVESLKAEGSYDGIKMDGSFTDWDSVNKTDVNNGLVNSVAMTFDGDWVYIYIDEVQPNASTWSGPGNSGSFVITTDLGRELKIQTMNGGTVSGAAGVVVARDYQNSDWHSDNPHYRWEIAIPKSDLPAYNRTISFGYYMGDTFVKDVANIDGSSGNSGTGSSGSTSGQTDVGNLSIDGNYGDWERYPHQLIEYDTAGTSHLFVDAEGSIYSSGDNTLGHVETQCEDHVSEMKGYEYTEFYVRVNGSSQTMIRAVLDKGNGNLDWNNGDTQNMPDGTYKFYLFDVGGWGATTNISNISQGDTLYGEMYVTVANGKDQTEYSINSDALAKRFGMSTSDVQTVGTRFHRIGNEWVETAGTSTNPYLGILLCMFPVLAFYIAKKRKEKNIE